MTATIEACRIFALVVVAGTVRGGVVALQIGISFYNLPLALGSRAIGTVLMPRLSSESVHGKLDGFAFRVPTLNVSIVDFSFVAKRPTTVDEVNSSVKQASESDLRGILEYNKEPLVSSDFNHNPASSIFDATLTKVVGGTLVKVSSWYDNEWGFSNRMLDATVAFVNAKQG